MEGGGVAVLIDGYGDGVGVGEGSENNMWVLVRDD